jgi:hypothetical protein
MSSAGDHGRLVEIAQALLTFGHDQRHSRLEAASCAETYFHRWAACPSIVRAMETVATACRNAKAKVFVGRWVAEQSTVPSIGPVINAAITTSAIPDIGPSAITFLQTCPGAEGAGAIAIALASEAQSNLGSQEY